MYFTRAYCSNVKAEIFFFLDFEVFHSLTQLSFFLSSSFGAVGKFLGGSGGVGGASVEFSGPVTLPENEFTTKHCFPEEI